MKILHIEDKDFFIEQVRDFFKHQKGIHIKDEIRRNADAIKVLEESKDYDAIILDGNLLDGKSTITLDWLFSNNYDKSNVIIYSGDIPLFIDAQKKGFTKLYMKSDSEGLFSALKEYI